VKKLIAGISIVIGLPTLFIFGPMAIDTMYQRQSHNLIRKLREDIRIGMDYRSVLSLVEASGWPKERRVYYDYANQLRLISPRIIYPQHAWVLVISFDDSNVVISIAVRSMDSNYGPPPGGPSDIP